MPIIRNSTGICRCLGSMIPLHGLTYVFPCPTNYKLQIQPLSACSYYAYRTLPDLRSEAWMSESFCRAKQQKNWAKFPWLCCPFEYERRNCLTRIYSFKERWTSDISRIVESLCTGQTEDLRTEGRGTLQPLPLIVANTKRIHSCGKSLLDCSERKLGVRRTGFQLTLTQIQIGLTWFNR